MKKETITGILFISILSIAFFRTIISTEGRAEQFPYRTKIYYSQIDGLLEGSEVFVKGIESGYILSIDVVPIQDVLDQKHLDPSREKAIELTLALKEPLTLWDNYKISFKTKTLFSGRVIDIDPGSFSLKDPIYFRPSYQVDDILPEYFPSARYIDTFFESANTIIVENQPDIRIAMIDSKELSAKLLGTNGSIPRLLNTMEAYDELNLTLDAIGILAREGRRYQEANRKLEKTFPIPFMISFGFFGGSTVTGRDVESITKIRQFPK